MNGACDKFVCHGLMGTKCDMNTFAGDRFKRVVIVNGRDFYTFIHR